ncbi:DUF3891 family protein [Virgibacillus sp. W0430]|uniref:DUF3891 family protein n=1 Tax=Virgibacillus sp. W0430 TaxID=3391580 RepID=UPI003F47E045
MIIRDSVDSFIMIEQHNHAHLAKDIAEKWKEIPRYTKNQPKASVMYAIGNHDRGWQAFDKAPFWNDRKKRPFTFIDLPLSVKAVLYTNGINEVEQEDLYAALLCSKHYTQFMQRAAGHDAQQFVVREEKRQHQLIHQHSTIDNNLLSTHLDFLKLCDNLSLYICLNDPGSNKDDEHPFFKEGIPIASTLQLSETGSMKVHLHWQDKKTIEMDPFPFEHNVHLTFPLKRIAKRTIADIGLLKAYNQAPYENKTVVLTPISINS